MSFLAFAVSQQIFKQTLCDSNPLN